jgi:hypothetical protein
VHVTCGNVCVAQVAVLLVLQFDFRCSKEISLGARHLKFCMKAGATVQCEIFQNQQYSIVVQGYFEMFGKFNRESLGLFKLYISPP